MARVCEPPLTCRMRCTTPFAARRPRSTRRFARLYWMRGDCLTLREAWAVYDRWISDPRIDMRREPFHVDALFRHTTEPFAKLASPKVLADCYLLAVANASEATLVTLDGGLAELGRR